MLHPGVAESIHMVDDAYVNWFLVEEAGTLTVVDTGHPSSWKSLRNALADLGHSFGDIEAVVLTHGHFDHMGFARHAHDQLGVPVWAHELEKPVVAHPWRYDHERGRLPYIIRHPGFAKIFAAIAQRARYGSRAWKMSAPTREASSSTCRADRKSSSLPAIHTAILRSRSVIAALSIAGDALVTLNPYTVRKGPQIVAGAATADSARALSSLDALAATRAQTVLCGHGPVWTQGVELAVERARSTGFS